MHLDFMSHPLTWRWQGLRPVYYSQPPGGSCHLICPHVHIMSRSTHKQGEVHVAAETTQMQPELVETATKAQRRHHIHHAAHSANTPSSQRAWITTGATSLASVIQPLQPPQARQLTQQKCKWQAGSVTIRHVPLSLSLFPSLFPSPSLFKSNVSRWMPALLIF